jgi:DNA-binding MarR family transcriptional regulator
MAEPAGPEMSVLFDLWLVNHLLSEALDGALAEESGLTGEEFGFYSLLRRFGPVSATQITRWTAIRPSTLSTQIRRLQQRGHVEQRPHPADGRSRLLALTSGGEDAHEAAARTFSAATRPLALALGREEGRQRASLERLDRALREAGGLDPRPYRLAEQSTGPTASISYDGPHLTTAEEHSVRAYIDFIRTRRQAGQS